MKGRSNLSKNILGKLTHSANLLFVKRNHLFSLSKILTIVFISLIGIQFSLAQVSSNYPFKGGEELQYKVYYNLAWVWVDAAEVSFSVTDSVYKKKKSTFFSSRGRSKPNYDWVFKVREAFSSYVNPIDLSPFMYSRNTSEGSHSVNNKYIFSSEKSEIYSFINNSEKGSKIDTLSYVPPIFDILSATYYLRTIDFENREIGDTIPVNTVMDNEIIKINVVFLGEEELEHKNNKKYLTYKFKTKGVEGSIFDEDSEFFVWVSKDKNKIPIKVESKILVGSVKAYISSIKKPKDAASLVIQDFL